MRKFEFPLQSALDLRRREEEAAIGRLAMARRIADTIRAELRQAQARYDELVAGIRDREGSGGPAPDLRLGEIEHAHRCLRRLRESMARGHVRLQQADRECEQCRADLLVAAQARETLEQLAQRQEAEHRRSEGRREQRELDEAAISRHCRLRDDNRAATAAGALPGHRTGVQA